MYYMFMCLNRTCVLDTHIFTFLAHTKVHQLLFISFNSNDYIIREELTLYLPSSVSAHL